MADQLSKHRLDTPPRAFDGGSHMKHACDVSFGSRILTIDDPDLVLVEAPLCFEGCLIDKFVAGIIPLQLTDASNHHEVAIRPRAPQYIKAKHPGFVACNPTDGNLASVALRRRAVLDNNGRDCRHGKQHQEER